MVGRCEGRDNRPCGGIREYNFGGKSPVVATDVETSGRTNKVVFAREREVQVSCDGESIDKSYKTEHNSNE